jgi:ligand-binding sensor domain-containing protein/DNA-binding CsgD family transcriptional regulator
MQLVATAPKLDLRFQHFCTDQGLSEDRIQHIFQDRRGFLWIATNFGLNRYDGYTFTHYQHRSGDPGTISNNQVIIMHDDHLGRLWVGTYSGLDILDPLTGRARHLNLGDPPTHFVSTLEETRGGEMWVGTYFNRIIRYEIASGRLLPLPKPITAWLAGVSASNVIIYRILEDVTGVIWISSSDGLYRYSPAKETLTLFSKTYEAIRPDNRDLIWIAYDSKLDCLDPRTGALRHFPVPKEKVGYALGCMLADCNQRVWIGSNSGIRLFNRDLGRYLELKPHLEDPGGPLQGFINSEFCEDTAGNIWIGVYGSGLYKFNQRFNHFVHIGAHVDPRLGLADPWVSAVYQDRSGIVWIGTRHGGLSRYDPESDTFSHYGGTLAFSTSDNPRTVEALREDSSGNLWVGTLNGLFMLDRRRDRLQRFPLTPAHPASKTLIPRRIFSIVEESPGRLWIGALGDGLFMVDTKQRTIVSVPFNESEPINMITAMLRDHAGNLWISTYNGLHCLSPQDGHCTHFYADPQKSDSLSSNRISSLLEDHSGNLWVGTDQGLNLMDRRRGAFRVFDEKQGLNGIYIYDLTEDDNGMIWVGTNVGLSRFDPQSETFRNFGAGDGMPIGGAYAACRGRDGKLLFGGYRGLTIFDPKLVSEINPHLPPMVFTALRIGNRSIPMNEVFSQHDQSKESGQVVLRPSDRVLSVEFAALDFTAPEKNRYAFRMEGETSEWNNLGTQHQVTFSGLGVGEHSMHIKGSNNASVWNEAGVLLQIVVLPQFWQTWWFRLLVLLGLALLAMGLVHLRRRFVALRRMAEPPNLDEICGKHDISKREQEVLRLVIQGKSNRDIENALFISIPTVKRHLANIFEKFGVHSRLQLIQFLRVRSTAPAPAEHPRPG